MMYGNVHEYTIGQWAEFDGFTVEETIEIYRSYEHGDAVTIYCDEESAICGVKYADGTFGIFGAGTDEDGLTECEMYTSIRYGY